MVIKMSSDPLSLPEWDGLLTKGLADVQVDESLQEPPGRLDLFRGSSTLPVLKTNFACIVAGISLRQVGDSLEILLIQEAELSRRGKWYLPAGRVEVGETLEGAFKREVKEEAGVECDYSRIVCLEQHKGTWCRVTFLFQVTGGTLKTKDNADKESLQAGWFPVSDVLKSVMHIRSTDFFALVHLAVDVFQQPQQFLPKVLEVPCSCHVWNLVISNESLDKIVVRNGGSGDLLPQYGYTVDVRATAVGIATKVFQDNQEVKITSAGVINVCADLRPPGKHDGIGATLLMLHSGEQSELQEGYSWRSINNDVADQLRLIKLGAAHYNQHPY